MRICSPPWQEGFSAASHSCSCWGGIDEKRNYSAPERGAPAAQLGSYVKGIWGFCISHMLRVYHSPFPPPPLPAQHRWSEAPEHAAIFKQELDRYVEISKISTCQLPQDFQWNRGFLSASSICHFHKEYMNLLFVGSFHRPIQSSLSAASQPSGWMSAQ